jgi:hypothetical protein
MFFRYKDGCYDRVHSVDIATSNTTEKMTLKKAQGLIKEEKDGTEAFTLLCGSRRRKKFQQGCCSPVYLTAAP